MLYYKKVLVGAAVMTLVFTTLAGCKGGNEAESSAMVSSAVSSLDEQPQKADLSNSAMLGNSYLDGFVTYNVLPDMDCFYRVGLNVRTVFTKTMLNHEIPVIDELQNGKSYDRVFLIFGENELGWPNTQAFYDGYGEVIDAVRERQPEAAVYIQSILPVSQEVSEKNIDCTNNEQILKFNEMLKEKKRYIFNYLNNLDQIWSIIENNKKIHADESQNIISSLLNLLIFDIVTLQLD